MTRKFATDQIHARKWKNYIFYRPLLPLIITLRSLHNKGRDIEPWTRSTFKDSAELLPNSFQPDWLIA